MIKVLFSRQAGAFYVFVEDTDGGVMLVIAQAGFHLRAQWTDQADVVVGPAPRREIFRIDVARFFEGIRRAARDVIDRFLSVFFGAGLIAPLQTPTIGAAAAEADESNDFGLFGESCEMRGHRPTSRVAEADYFTTGETLVGEKPRTLKNHIESAFQIAIENFFGWQFPVHEVDRHSLRNRLFPDAPLGVMARICESQNIKALECDDARQTGSSIRCKIHNFLAAGAAMKNDKGSVTVEFFFRSEQRPMDVPVITIAVVTRDNVLAGNFHIGVGRFDGKPFIPIECQ